MMIRILTTLSFYLAPLTAKLKNSSRSFLERLASFLSSPLLSRQVLLRVSRQTGPYTCSTTVRLDESPPDFDYWTMFSVLDTSLHHQKHLHYVIANTTFAQDWQSTLSFLTDLTNVPCFLLIIILLQLGRSMCSWTARQTEAPVASSLQEAAGVGTVPTLLSGHHRRRVVKTRIDRE